MMSYWPKIYTAKITMGDVANKIAIYFAFCDFPDIAFPIKKITNMVAK